MRSIVTDRRFINCIVPVLVILGFIFFVCKGYIDPNPEKMSPKESTNFYYKASFSGNTSLLEKLIYFPPGTTEQQKQKRIDACNLNRSPAAKAILGMMGMKIVAQYEKYIDENTAEVGVVSKAGILQSLLAGKPSYIWKSEPAYKIILKKDQGVWKYYHKKDNFTSISELVEAMKNDPEDASLYYYYGLHAISENPYRTHRYFKKYYELEPNGFWITERFMENLKEFEDINHFESIMLNGDSPPGNRSGVYTKIGLGFAECGDYAKANQYYKKAAEVLLKHPSPLAEERLVEAQKELQLRLEGKYQDLLDELERSQEN